jgi:hypothetical protein
MLCEAKVIIALLLMTQFLFAPRWRVAMTLLMLRNNVAEKEDKLDQCSIFTSVILIVDCYNPAEDANNIVPILVKNSTPLLVR